MPTDRSGPELPVAIIGTGAIARAHVSAARAQGGRLRLAGALDIDPARAQAFCAEHGIPAAYADVDRMLAEVRPRIVMICTPPMTHADLCIRAMEAGAWAFCEKPLCSGLEQFDRIAAAEDRTGNYTSSVFQWRFGSAGRHFRRIISEGVLGRPLVGVCNATWYRDAAYYAVPWRGKWSTEIGGTSMGHGIHSMDFFLWLMGPWAEVRAMAGTLDRDIEVDDTSMALVRFESGMMASFVNSCLCPREESYLRWDFQRATVELTHLYAYGNENWRFTPLKSEAESMAGSAWNIADNEHSSHAAQLRMTLEAMDAGRRPPVSGPDLRPTFEFVSALYKSAATGQIVRPGDIRPGDPFYRHVAGKL